MGLRDDDGVDFRVLSLVKEHPNFKHQETGFKSIKREWIKQSTGYLGDDFYGTVWLELKKDELYLHYHFEC